MTPSWKRERHNKSRRGQDKRNGCGPSTYGMEIPTDEQDIMFGLMREADRDEGDSRMNARIPIRRGRNRRGHDG
jgi:hypothetical protein